MRDFPGIILTATVWAYWLGAGGMVVRLRRKSRSSAGLIPEQPLERLMWLVWVPLVVAWNVLPYLAVVRRVPSLRVPNFALEEPAYAALRAAAALAATVCVILTAWCWARMGKSWSMAVSERNRGELITDGLFARVRHPIYSLSMLLMVCSAVVVPTPPVVAIALVHIWLMRLKARSEERHLLKVHGDAYASYLRRTGRFVPRFGATGPEPRAGPCPPDSPRCGH
ncbi:MAG TPA: isoprenylcysteine carboxylmethyltransferase family protein [Casimicrobiaceae bacterium]|nr:isoprenylcysteine carboxylmethyltransferase family protein [Casimicrobiaceae bacterium]